MPIPELKYRRSQIDPWTSKYTGSSPDVPEYKVVIGDQKQGYNASTWLVTLHFRGERITRIRLRGLPTAKEAGCALIAAHQEGVKYGALERYDD